MGKMVNDFVVHKSFQYFGNMIEKCDIGLEFLTLVLFPDLNTGTSYGINFPFNLNNSTTET